VERLDSEPPAPFVAGLSGTTSSIEDDDAALASALPASAVRPAIHESPTLLFPWQERVVIAIDLVDDNDDGDDPAIAAAPDRRSDASPPPTESTVIELTSGSGM
jgi:hypothetical protein